MRQDSVSMLTHLAGMPGLRIVNTQSAPLASAPPAAEFVIGFAGNRAVDLIFLLAHRLCCGRGIP
jgi:hypothetical protein